MVLHHKSSFLPFLQPDGTDLFNFINGYLSWADYLTAMEQVGTWGDHVILHAVAYRFETNIDVISSRSDYSDISIRPDRHVISTNPLVVGHIHEVHYVSLRPKQGEAWGAACCAIREHVIDLYDFIEVKALFIIES